MSFVASPKEALAHAYVPYSNFPVGVAAIVDDGRILSGANVENASYGLTLCAECALVSSLHMTGGGKLVAFTCVDGHGNILMPCGRCRQLLFEHSADGMLLETVSGDQDDRRGDPGRVRAANARGSTGPPMVEQFDVVDLIRTKRDKGTLTTPQIDWLIDAYTRGYVADEQMSAMTMAIFLERMTREEIRDLTMAMIASGERMSFGDLGKPTTDKHSTGGVGDKITLPLAPLVASFGVAVPQLSGRGLGHTGGTLDKLESIPGWRANLSNEEMRQQLTRRGRGDLRGRLRARSRRRQALRAARHHRHRGGHPAHRILDHEQEDRRGHLRAGARRASSARVRS